MITEEQIEASRTPNGGWNKSTLEEWGVPWPPPKGWREHLIRTGNKYQENIKNTTSEGNA